MGYRQIKQDSVGQPWFKYNSHIEGHTMKQIKGHREKNHTAEAGVGLTLR